MPIDNKKKFLFKRLRNKIVFDAGMSQKYRTVSQIFRSMGPPLTGSPVIQNLVLPWYGAENFNGLRVRFQEVPRGN